MFEGVDMRMPSCFLHLRVLSDMQHLNIVFWIQPGWQF